jgi:hypothetical protein
MAQEMIDSYKGNPENVGKGLGRRDSDQQGTDESRSLGHGDRVDPGESHPGVGTRFFDDREDRLDVLAGGKLRDNPPVLSVQRYLGGDDAGEDLAAVLHDRGGGFIAGGLNA